MRSPFEPSSLPLYVFTAQLFQAQTWTCLYLCFAGIVDAGFKRHREELSKEEHGNKGRWVAAETIGLEHAQSLLPAQHPYLSEPYAEGLPQTCLTYKQRYANYKKPSKDM